jgi:hypothetical protein
MDNKKSLNRGLHKDFKVIAKAFYSPYKAGEQAMQSNP